MKHAYSEKGKAKISGHGLAVHKIDLEGNIIKTYKNIREAGADTGICDRHISTVCKRKRRTAGNYVWRYVHDQNIIKEKVIPRKRIGQKVIQYNLEGKLIREFHSAKDAAAYCDITERTMRDKINTVYKNSIWKYG